METLNPYLFIHIGLGIRALRHCKGLVTYNFVVLEGNQLILNLKSASFNVSFAGRTGLSNFIDKIKSLPLQVQGNFLGEKEVTELSQIMDTIEKMVYAEASTKSIFIVSGGRYNLETLMEYPERMFTVDVFTNLPEVAKYDLQEGFLCLIFSRATAAAFHVLRAIEAVLKELYLLNIKRKRIKKPTWGDMTFALNKRKNIDKRLIDRLDYIRVNYRNETDHPLSTYSIKDAENIVGLCIEVIEKMSFYIPKRPEISLKI